ncbi:1-Cys peroxiredoxin [Operophtera brumata]|uniref:1-Cys peroxiredoxin n=1 Tax=Operophtera brumata TaxID=104452 RepID=A0A0L7L3H3_OPEBR|nr:1-Cys peroxiredoxin [Operophtera brumata]
MLLLGDSFPNFSANTTEGEIDFHDWLGDSNTKVIGLSCDTVLSHLEWCKDIKNYAGQNEDEVFPYPIIEDKDRALATKLGMVDKDELDLAGMPLTARAVFMGDDCMVLPTVPEDQISKVFPEGVKVVPMPSGKNYLRKVSCPKV